MVEDHERELLASVRKVEFSFDFKAAAGVDPSCYGDVASGAQGALFNELLRDSGARLKDEE